MYLLDTHAFLWWTSDASRLSGRATEILNDTSNIIFISVVNIWEIQIKSQLGKLTLPEHLETIVSKQTSEQGFQLLQITLGHFYAP